MGICSLGKKSRLYASSEFSDMTWRSRDKYEQEAGPSPYQPSPAAFGHASCLVSEASAYGEAKLPACDPGDDRRVDQRQGDVLVRARHVFEREVRLERLEELLDGPAGTIDGGTA